MSKPCEIAVVVFGDRLPCPALENPPGGTRCGLMVRPLKYVPRLRRHGGARLAAAARLILRVGLGCDSRYVGEANPAFDTAIDSYRREHATAIRKARKLWGLPALRPAGSDEARA